MSGPTPEQALVTVEIRGATPTLDLAARQLGVEAADLDAGFGLVPLDPRGGLYAVRVRADRLPAGFAQREPYAGPYADPEIAPLGPVVAPPKRDEEEG